MEFSEIVLKSLKYIEENINEVIKAEDIAKEAGYSLYYFSRMFRKQVGLSIMEYVKERRLIKASEEIGNGRKIIDVALEYGYESHSSFTKAFKNKFGFSPALLRAFCFQIDCLGGNCNMKHVFMRNTKIHAAKEELYEILKSIIIENGLEYNGENIKKAYEFACEAHKGEKRYSGDDYVTHSINTAIILAEMGASEEAVIAGLLHDVNFEKEKLSIEKVAAEFSVRIAEIITEVKTFKQQEVIDEEVIMVKLSDRLHNMRTIEFIDETRWKEKAKENLDIFAPIAAKLNNKKIMAELNDLSVKRL